MLRVGLTGGIGSGKSTVAAVFRVLGVPVFEADAEGKRMLDEDGALRDAVAGRFGADLYAGGRLDRAALAKRVFGDAQALAALNALVHPAVRKGFANWCGEQRSPYVVMEAAILVESGGHALLDRLVVVSAPERLRVERVMRRDGVEEAQVHARMAHQATDEERLAKAHHVIVNDDTRLVVPQVIALHQVLLAEAP